MNGVVEAANKNIKKIIQKMVVMYRDWHDIIPFALHGYRTSVQTLIGATHFSLVYGMEVVLPIEVEIPSMCVLMEAKLTKVEWCQTRFDQLNLIEDERLTIMCHGAKKDLIFQTLFYGKRTPNYEGSYVVKKAFSGGVLILTTMDGEEFTRPMNTDAVKKYFA
ncbi:hypothetical protein KIW84_042966 [Lathyrus oleraceus]|uniref:Uncharacterized protein n=1 Tax=Pisum sativum TaxID=3888 RepID=A0A9D5AU11_PEA|nr:hypothetical protein KIW84_042966 [Pisum sativum]